MEKSLKAIIDVYTEKEKEFTELNSNLMEIDSDLREIKNDKHRDPDPIEDIQTEKYKPHAQSVTHNVNVHTAASGTNDNKNQLFFSQSRPDDINPFVDEEKPTSWSNFDPIDIENDEDSQADLLGEGKTLLTTRRSRKLYMNSYGPKNSAMLT